MIRRHYLVEIKRVKELPLSTLLPPHHGPLPRITSQSDGITVRPWSQREFCNTFPPKADMAAHFMSTRPGKRRQNLRWPSYGSGISGTNAVCEANCVGIATLSSFPAQRLDLRKNAAPTEYLPFRVPGPPQKKAAAGREDTGDSSCAPSQESRPLHCSRTMPRKPRMRRCRLQA